MLLDDFCQVSGLVSILALYAPARSFTALFTILFIIAVLPGILLTFKSLYSFLTLVGRPNHEWDQCFGSGMCGALLFAYVPMWFGGALGAHFV